MKKIILLSVTAIALVFKLSAQTETNSTLQSNQVNHTYIKTSGPDKNPLKGWNSGWWNDFEHASVGFQYLKWKEFEPTDGNFNFSAVESVLNRPGTNGRHFILRLYTDWYGTQAISDACPQWIYDDYGVARLQAPNGKYITDYNNPQFIIQAIEAIEALANHYNNDPRAYAFQLGVLGYWGEWHAHSFNDDTFEITENTKTQILNAYKNSFTNTKLMGRYPWREPLSTANGIGFHNDYFKPNNSHSDEFDDAVFLNDKWLQGPIGGEIPPGLTSSDYNNLYGTITGMNMIERGHYSTMQAGSSSTPCINGPNSANCDGFMAMHRKMGYNFQIDSAIFSETLSQSDNLLVDLVIENIGVAPIYYDWDVQFALLDQDNLPIQIFDVNFDLTTILPNQTFYTIPLISPMTNITSNNYQLGVRFIQPNADESKSAPWGLDARNTYIVFSNQITTLEGQWDSNEILKGGWAILGNIMIEDSTLGINNNTLSENKLSMYPNPAKNQISIVKKEAFDLNTMKLYDAMGRLIESYDLNNMGNRKNIDISNLSSGHYILIINSTNNYIHKQFIKE